MKKARARLDVLMVERGLAESRHKAQALIMAGSVEVGGAVIDKAGKEVDLDAEILVKKGLPYVGRGGLKLEGALDAFSLDVSGFTAMDVGSSTGGFTDCLLKRGAARVYAVDVGKGIIDESLRRDPRVVLLEEKNIRHLADEEVGEKADIAVIDVSFISLKIVIPAALRFVKQGGKILALVKPQFEVGKENVGRGGIVRDERLHSAVTRELKGFSEGLGLKVLGETVSPITGAKGNKEFWLYLSS